MKLYKKVFVNLAKVLPDSIYLRMVFFSKLKRKLDLSNPKSYNEKLNWLKINDRKEHYQIMVDKYEAKKYVADKIGEQYVIPTYGVWDRFEDIDFSKLPSNFVLKTTHDSGGVVLINDKNNMDIDKTKDVLEKSLKNNYYYLCREWPYKNVRPRILAEEYMVDEHGDGLKDYKFYCFNGVPKYLYVSQGMNDHKTARVSFITMNWEKAPFGRADYPEFEALPSKPIKFDKMVSVAKKLSEEQPFLRVDLYEISGEVYFSELTLFPCGGLMPFVPKEWDRKLGDMIELS